MEITLLGYLLIPVSLVLLFVKREYLFYIFVFFSAFTAASVINVKSITFGLQPAFWLAMLWFISKGVSILKNGIKLNKIQARFVKAALIFAAIVILSTLMPVYFNKIGKLITVVSPDNKAVKLVYSKSNITQVLYVIFCLMVSIFTFIEIDSREKMNKTLKTLFCGLVFSLVWGIMQFFVYYLGIRYPADLFNNSLSFLQYWGVVENGVKRVNSIAPEPSMYAFYLLNVIPILGAIFLYDIKLMDRRITAAIFGLSMLVLLLTTSTTAYAVGFLYVVVVNIGLFVSGFKSNKGRLIKFNLMVVLAILATFAIYTTVANISVNKTVNLSKKMTVDKGKTESGKLRTSGFKGSIQLFTESPILGVGYGSNRSMDLFTTLLSTTGVAGTAAAAYLMITAAAALARMRKAITGDKGASAVINGLSLSLLLAFACYAVSIPDIIFLYFWIILGIIISLPAYIKS